jgi:hypothetical protein
MERLASTATLHVHHELVYEFLAPFPDNLSNALATVPSPLDRERIMPFLRENPTVYRHYQLQERAKILERVRDKLNLLKHHNA